MASIFEHLEPNIETAFRSFIRELLRLDSEPLRYYYWTRDFFENNGNLSFSYFELNLEQKEAINILGKEYFEDKEVYFEVNKNSHRHDLTIKNIHKIFTDNKKSGQTNRYEYIKEFIFWQIIDDLSNRNNSIPKDIIEVQKKNFLITYLNYLFEHTKKPSFDEFKNYTSFERTNQYEEIKAKLDDLDKKSVDNAVLRNKLSKLFVHKDKQANMHFVFSLAGSGEKEELRELLDVMGREKTGAYYRGQASSMWELDSSLTREQKYIDKEDQMYYDILSSKPDAFVEDKTVYERLITMQHFGMPTRLMDITRNPLVAIFFACNNLERAKSDGMIFTFAPTNTDFLNFEDDKLESLKKLFDKNCKSTEPDDFLDSLCFIKGVAKNQRISSQSGDFIFVGKGENIKKELHNLPALSIIIDAPTKKVLLEQLESLNIHGGAVYPDLSHMSNYVRNKYLYDKKSGKDFTTDISLPKPKSIVEKSDNVVDHNNESTGTAITPLISKFDENSFWTKNRDNAINTFSIEKNLKQEELKGVINEYFFSEKEPLRDDVIQAMQKAPLLSERGKIIPALIGEILAFANQLKSIE